MFLKTQSVIFFFQPDELANANLNTLTLVLPFSCRLGKHIPNPPVKCFDRHFYPDAINNKAKTMHTSMLTLREVLDGNANNWSFKCFYPPKSHIPTCHNLLSSFSIFGVK